MDEIRQASLGAAVARSPEVADGGAKWGRLILSVGLSALEPYPRSVISGFGAIMTSRPFSRCPPEATPPLLELLAAASMSKMWSNCAALCSARRGK